MKKTCRVIALALVLVTTVLCLVSCGNSLKGTWEGEAKIGEYSFESDGKGKIAVGSLSTDFTYKTDGDKLTLTKTVAGVSIDTEYTYKVAPKMLSLHESNPVIALEFTTKKCSQKRNRLKTRFFFCKCFKKMKNVLDKIAYFAYS